MSYPPWTSVSEAAALLASGHIVAIPTETVYGLAGNALDPLALAKIFAAKGRPVFDPLIVHIADINSLDNVAQDIPEAAYTLARTFWPGPLTMVLPKKPCIPDLATSGLSTVAVRLPQHPIAQDIIRQAEVPLAAPSANLFKHVSPTTAEHVADQLGSKIDGIVDGGPCSVGVESTIISFQNEIPVILRPGAITPLMIESVIGKVILKNSTSNPGEAMLSPGTMDTHYQPHIPLYYGDLPKGYVLPSNTVRLAFGNTVSNIPASLNLSETGNLTEATANLYAFMHKLDVEPNRFILVDPIPNEGLGIALNDRLKRASIKRL
ncbi:MAG: threonylcarbamoyl-AMP synthase [Fibrobacter sp.]|jgi:L-threonylcarbamoyladenylate synthase|nr:threonylcarbamoyl-AMP synthase [Fibrobacter sp.]